MGQLSGWAVVWMKQETTSARWWLSRRAPRPPRYHAV